jgi:hypothetical protein
MTSTEPSKITLPKPNQEKSGDRSEKKRNQKIEEKKFEES